MSIFGKNSKTISRAAVVLMFIGFISACGGGGGGSPQTTTPTPTASSDWDEMNWDQDNWG